MNLEGRFAASQGAAASPSLKHSRFVLELNLEIAILSLVLLRYWCGLDTQCDKFIGDRATVCCRNVADNSLFFAVIPLFRHSYGRCFYRTKVNQISVLSSFRKRSQNRGRIATARRSLPGRGLQPRGRGGQKHHSGDWAKRARTSPPRAATRSPRPRSRAAAGRIGNTSRRSRRATAGHRDPGRCRAGRSPSRCRHR